MKIAVDMVSEGIVDRETSVANIRASDINKLVLKQLKTRILSTQRLLIISTPYSNGLMNSGR